MSKAELIDKAISNLRVLPDEQVHEILDFTEFLLAKAAGKSLTEEVTKANATSQSYKFLEEDTDLYTANDVIEKYS